MIVSRIWLLDVFGVGCYVRAWEGPFRSFLAVSSRGEAWALCAWTLTPNPEP